MLRLWGTITVLSTMWEDVIKVYLRVLWWPYSAALLPKTWSLVTNPISLAENAANTVRCPASTEAYVPLAATD